MTHFNMCIDLRKVTVAEMHQILDLVGEDLSQLEDPLDYPYLFLSELGYNTLCKDTNLKDIQMLEVNFETFKSYSHNLADC